MEDRLKKSQLARLARIEGQVRGVARMVEEDRYCIDIVTQISAVRAALRRLEEEVLRDHVAHCVNQAIASGDQTEQRRKVAVGDDLVAVHTHPFNAVSVGDTVYLHLDPASCNGLPADDREGVDDSMLGD